MVEQALPLYSQRSLVREFDQYVPFWFIYLEAMGLLHLGLANFPDSGFAAMGIPRFYFAAMLLFPLAWLSLFLVLRLYRSSRLRPMPQTWAALAGFLLGVPALIVACHQRTVLDHNQLTAVFEASQFFWVAILAVQIVRTRGWHSLGMFFGVTFIYGLILENAGIYMGFFFEPSFRLYLGPLPAPLCTMIGWCVVFYVTVAVVQQLAAWVPWLGKTAWRRALATTMLALSLDAQLDPLASMSGVFWRWNELLPPVLLGVPVINYAAWFGAFLPYSYFVYKTLDRDDWSPKQKNLQLLLRVPLAAGLGGAICFTLMAVAEGGISGPTFIILEQFVRGILG